MARFDVLILGAGAAGCALAGRLSENPDRSVCLVEAGPDYGHYDEGRWPADILDARRLALDSHRWERDDEDDRSQIRARVLGGCSAHNACVVLRGAPEDYEWGPGWSYAELEPYLRRGGETLGTRPTPWEELSPWHRAFAEAGGDDAILHPVNALGDIRWHAGFAYVDPARGRPNLTILADSIVDRVLLSDGRATGAVAGGRQLTGVVVVVCGGAYGSPGILLRSGIGPDGEVVELPVGEGLADHAGTGAAWTPTERLVRETAEHEARHGLWMGQVTISREGGSLFTFPALDPGPEISGAVFAMKPFSRGSVRLNGPDAETPLAIDHGFLRDERDVEMVTAGFEGLRELASSEPVAPYVQAEARPGAEVDAKIHVRATARGFFHPVATCAIGEVLDERCRVLGLENLYVVDASAVPIIPRANTHLTTVALAERAAEWI
jgi:choline dehydrogenase